MLPNEIYNHIIEGEAVLFIGAGFSRDAMNVKDQKMKDASQLSEDLCKDMKIKLSQDLGVVSDYYLGDKSAPQYVSRAQKLITKLQDNFTCKSVSPAQEKIAANQWIRVYTTNYDDVFEKAGNKDRRFDRTPMTMKNSIDQIRNTDSVVHLNGYIRNLDIARLEDEFKLCTRSYFVDDFQRSDIAGLFYRDIREARIVVFIGVSLNYDIDIQRIIYDHNACKEKFIFIDRKQAPEEIDIIEDRKKNILGKVYHIGLEQFANELEEAKTNYKPVREKINYRCFEYIKLGNTKIDRGGVLDLWNLYATGNLNKEILCSHINDDAYLVRRSVIKEIEANIESNEMTVNIIHSNLGNGKTCLMEYLKYYFAEKYHVFQFKETYSDYSRELSAIAKLDGKKILLFENYNLYIKAIEQIRYHFDESWNIILSCRTYINYNSIYKLSSALKMDIGKFYEFDIDRFTDEEKDKVIASLKSINHADFKDLKNNKAIRLLNDKMQNRWVNTVLYLFQSRAISDKLKKIYDNIKINRNNLEVVIAAIINNVVGMNLSYNQLLTLIRKRQADISIIHDENVAELLNMHDGVIEIKSSLLSLYLIRSKELYSDVIRVMKKMVLNSNQLIDSDFEMVKRLLISSSNISELFYKKIPFFESEKDGNELSNELLEYFADISKVKYYENNEFFWLQYAMACMDMKEYGLAENNFRLAHQYEKEKSVESYQIKVQYGRFLLEKALAEGNEKMPIRVLKKVTDEWKKVLQNDEAQKFYVYKQIYQYGQFLDEYAPQFNEEDYNKAIKLIETLTKTIRKCDKNDHRKSSREEALGILDKSAAKLLMAVVK